ncbi:MAG: glycosyl transferase family 2 [Lysobacterales bacterium]|nr:glycosyl transferase family 2 [Xanthomonadales bacterium]MCB1611090.1 glycosyl transferase family 2 [Xanthomonadales bacterium]MCP5476992.1 glycosyl transferase family 2 [Rhodanobacteraceae bacterium]
MRDSAHGTRDSTGTAPAELGSVAVIIPVGPGDRSWRTLLDILDRLAPTLERRLVFAHGDLQSRPRAPSERWTESSRGRARQQNAGAAGIDSEWLWFVHADSRPEQSTLKALGEFVSRGEDAIGYFDLKFVDDGPALMWLTAAAANWRSRTLGMPFGDQGLVLPRNRFYELGGFDESRPYGEDHALIWQARRSGVPIKRIPAALGTSARRYRDQGWLLTTLRHQRLTWVQAWQESRSR